MHRSTPWQEDRPSGLGGGCRWVEAQRQQPSLIGQLARSTPRAALGRSASFKSERERFDRRRSQFDALRSGDSFRSHHWGLRQTAKCGHPRIGPIKSAFGMDRRDHLVNALGRRSTEWPDNRRSPNCCPKRHRWPSDPPERLTHVNTVRHRVGDPENIHRTRRNSHDGPKADWLGNGPCLCISRMRRCASRRNAGARRYRFVSHLGLRRYEVCPLRR
jgi:hypothetical protein